jgi:NAD(P)H-hydrate epimerase
VIPLLTREAARDVDVDAVSRLGLPSVLLMENAGAGATQLLLQRFRGELQRIVILGGTGQNGGDAWVLARHLLNTGIVPHCVLIGDPAKVSGDAALNLSALRALGLPVLNAQTAAAVAESLADATTIVDGLFGTGLDRPLAGELATIVDAVNASAGSVFALDLPSGVDADTGEVLGKAVRARVTATFAAHKRGLHQHPGAAHAGEVVVVSIGVPAPTHADVMLLERADVAAQMPQRAEHGYKGSHGDVLVIAGSLGKTGAALLSALAAMRAGAGLVTIAAQSDARQALDHKVVEIMTQDLGADPVTKALELARDRDATVLGPGAGLDATTLRNLHSLALSIPVPTVLDADALRALQGDVAALRSAKGRRVLTPHPGEAAGLLGVSIGDVQRDRYAAALRLAQESAHVVVLKGARTVIAAPEGLLRVCSAGTVALGVAGTGDVLAGVIAALCCHLSPFDAACTGAMLHGVAGELAAQSDRGLFASEVAAAIPRALQACRSTAVPQA